MCALSAPILLSSLAQAISVCPFTVPTVSPAVQPTPSLGRSHSWGALHFWKALFYLFPLWINRRATCFFYVC